MQCKSLKEEKFETLIHDLQTSILMVKKVARQNNDLLKYNVTHGGCAKQSIIRFPTKR